jgi:hypothetical protein
MFYTDNIRSLTDYDIYEKFAWRPIRSDTGKRIFWKNYYVIVNWTLYGDPIRDTLTENEFLLWQLEYEQPTGADCRLMQMRSAFFSRNYRLIKGLQRLSKK